MQAYDASWSALPSEGLPGSRPGSTDGPAGPAHLRVVGGAANRLQTVDPVGGLHAVTLSPTPDEPAALGSDLMAFLSDFRAAQYEPAPPADGAPSAGPAGSAADGVAAVGGPEASIHWIGGQRPGVEEYYDPYEGRTAPAGPGWWQASDHLWYAPEVHPDAQVAEPAPAEAVAPAAAAPDGAAADVAAADVAAAPAVTVPDAEEQGRGRLRLGRLGRRG